MNKNHIGETIINNYGSIITLIKYESYSHILVRFDNGYEKWCTYENFKNKSIKSPYCKTVYNHGYVGEGEYSSKLNHNIYQSWIDVLKRSYSNRISNKWETYKNVTCCEEWFNFQNFAKWYDENYYVVDGEKMHLDKDILIKNNKIYSPDTCIFVPQRINELFIKTNKLRGNLPIGVSYLKNINKFQANCKTFTKRGSASYSNYLGCFKTPLEAFNVYKQFKEKYIKQVADEYKNKIPQKLYEAMYRYEVEITD